MHWKIGRFSSNGGLLLVFLLAACTTSAPESSRGLPDFPKPAAVEVISVAFDNITDKYIEPVPLREVAVEGLRGLGAIDAGIAIDDTGRSIRLSIGGNPIAEQPYPKADSPRAWADTVVTLITDARIRSIELRTANAERIYEAVLDSALSHLDIFSRYAGAEEARRQRAKRDGFGGIGVRFRIDGNYPVVSEVLPGTPAAITGLVPGDRLIRIGDVDVKGFDERRVIDQLRGPVDTHIRVTFTRPEAVQPVTVDIARAHIVPESVVSRIDKGIVIVRIESFNQNTGESIRKVLTDATSHKDAPVHGLILDLRGNPGGLLRQSIKVSDYLLTQGDILKTLGRHVESQHHYQASGSDLVSGLPVVVLVDGKSASAAEIVAAALQDRDRAVVVGTASYGKGTVQTVIRLPNDGEITLTWSKFVAPSGYVLHGLGVIPTICTSGKGDDINPSSLISQALGVGADDAANLWRRRATLGEEERRGLRSSCPSQPRPGTVDMEIAKRLINNGQYLARALHLATTTALATQ